MPEATVFIVLLLALVLGSVALFAVCRLFAIERHLARLVHIAEHQADIAPNEVFLTERQARGTSASSR
jgi:hypothetical protein